MSLLIKNVPFPSMQLYNRSLLRIRNRILIVFITVIIIIINATSQELPPVVLARRRVDSLIGRKYYLGLCNRARRLRNMYI